MAKSDKLSELDVLSKKIIADVVAITSVKYRDVLQWHVGISEDMNYDINTVKNYSLFLMYKIDNSNDCKLIYKALVSNIGLINKLNFPTEMPNNPKYIVLWHAEGLDAETV